MGLCSTPEAPDYTPVAEASAESAAIAAALGREQLEEARRQYDLNMQIVQPVVDAQLDMMNKSAAQADDYYNYGKSFRPIEQQMLAQGMGALSAADIVRANRLGLPLSATLGAQAAGQPLPPAGTTPTPTATVAQSQSQSQAQAQAQSQAPAAMQQASSQSVAAAQHTPAQLEAALAKYHTAPDGFNWKAVLDQGPPPGYNGGPIVTTAGQQMTPELQAALDYNKALRYQSSYTNRAEADLQHGTGGYTMSQAGAIPNASSTAQDPGVSDTSGFVIGGVPAGTQSMAQYHKDNPKATLPGVSQQQQQAAQSVFSDGSIVRAIMDQIERDQITGEQRANAGKLAERTRLFEQDAGADIGLFTGGDAGILNKYGTDIEHDVGRAVADARAGQSRNMNQAIRQALRYGLNVPGSVSGLALGGASMEAAAANNTRNAAVDKYRSLVGQGMDLKRATFTTGHSALTDAMTRGENAAMTARDMRVADETRDWGKKLDIAGLGRNMPGASQGAYGVSIAAGNSAASNRQAPGQALVGQMGQAAGTTMQGRQLLQSGLGNVLNAQASAYGSSQNFMGEVLGTGLGAAIGAFSDRRLKTDVRRIGDDPRGFGWYEFRYLWGGPMRVGVMADEVRAVMPAAVFTVSGFDAVRYDML